MTSLFDKLPPELIAQIGSDLDLPSLISLRLVSSSPHKRFTPQFLQYIDDTQSVDLTRPGLQKLRSLASSTTLRHVIRNLRLICIYYHETPAHAGPETTFPGVLFFRRPAWHAQYEPLSLLDNPSERQWMDERQAEQAAFSGEIMSEQLSSALENFGDFEGISLEAAVILSREHRWEPKKVENLAWRKLWMRAIQAYRVVMSAIARSQINLSSLSIYEETALCSVPTNEVAAILSRLEEEGFAAAARRFKHFSISLATTVFPIRPTQLSTAGSTLFYEPFDISAGRTALADDPATDAHAEFENLSRLFGLMPNLETLSIHLYRTVKPQAEANDKIPYQPLLESLFRIIVFPHLQSLTLRGLPATTETMGNILHGCPQIRAIHLRNIFLVNGLWDQALAAVTSQRPASLKQLHLSNLWHLHSNGDASTEGGGAGVSWTWRCTNLESQHKKLTRKDLIDLMNGTASAECRRYANNEAVRWHTKEIGEEELRKGVADFDPNSWGPKGGMADGYDYVWGLMWPVECGPPP